MNYLTYSYLLTPLHTGASSQAGNMMGIAREAHTDLPYLPSSSLRGKIRSILETLHPDEAGMLFGERLKGEQQPTEGEVWFADASLLLFPIASYSHQYVWITCPLWLSRWNRWLGNTDIDALIKIWRNTLTQTKEEGGKSAVTSIQSKSIYLQGALLKEQDIVTISETDPQTTCWEEFAKIPDGNGVLDLQQKLVILGDGDCAALVETGLQREVRIALKEKIVDRGSFRSEESIPSETVLFFPWGFKPLNPDPEKSTEMVRQSLINTLDSKIQYGGLEGLGRGWTINSTVNLNTEEVRNDEIRHS
jgi:CRISPR-associated protein Cmr4